MMKSIEKLKKPLIDIMLNIISNGLPTIVLQLIVYPLVALKLGATRNDLFLVFMSVIHIIVASTSGSLCNTRLLLNSDYIQKQVKGDFNLIVFIFSGLNIIILIIVSIIYNSTDIIDIFMMVFLSLLWMARDYLIVEFRLNLNFREILYNNIVLVIGIILGIIGFNFCFENWRIIFIISYGLSLIHVIKRTEIWKEPLKRTVLFPTTIKKVIVLSFSTCIGLIPSTCSSLFIYQFGSSWVSIYTSALIIGKILSMISSPLSSVLISYIVRVKKLSIKYYNYSIIFIFGVGSLGYFFCYIISKPILNILYPLWASDSLKFVPITVGIAVLDLLSMMINPIILHFAHEKWQLIVQMTYSIIYFVLGLIIVNLGSIYLFAVMNLILSLARAVFMACLGRSIIIKRNKDFNR